MSSNHPELPSGTVTFLFTDIESSTALLKRLGDRYAGVLDDHRLLLREAFVAQGGREIDTQGDSFFFVFARAKHAIAAAIDAQRALSAHKWPEHVELRVRMGLHSGEPLVGEDRYVGIGVNRAARLGAAAHGGQVLVSDATRALVEDDLPEGIFMSDLGYWELKDIDRPERVSQLVTEGLQAGFPPLRGAEQVKERPVLRRRSLLLAMLAGVVAAAVAIPVFALGSGSSGPTALAGVGANAVGALDLATGRIAASIPVQTGPSSVAVGADSVWVTNTADNSVSRIDPKTNAVVQTIRVGSGPEGIAVGGGFVWVANSLDGTVFQIDPGTNSVVRRIEVGNGPTGVAYGLDGVWVTNSADNSVMRINPHSGKTGVPIQVSGAAGIAVGDGEVWVASGASPGSVARVDPGTGNVQTIPVGSGPGAVAVGPGTVWVANSLDDTVSRIDPASNKVDATILVGAGPSGISVGRGIVWVSNEQGGTLSRIDPSKNTVVRTVEAGNRPAGVGVNADTMYVAVRTSGLAHRGGTLTLLGTDISSYEPTIDPAYQEDADLILTNDGLTGYRHIGGSEGTQLVPDLAVSLPTPTDGGTTYTFQLRKEIRYSTGALVKPADIRRAIERSLANPTGAGPIFLSGIIGAKACTNKRCDLSKGIVADPAANTITFHLSAPDPDFLYKLALPFAFVVPAGTPLKAQPSPLPATGPYEFARFDAKREIRLVRNPYFHEWSAAAQPDGYPAEIVWKLGSATDPNLQATQLRAVERGRADFAASGVPTTRRNEIATGFAGQLHVNPQSGTFYMPLNTRLPPFNNLKARQAFNYAVDRNRMATYSIGAKLPSCQVLPPGFFGYQRYCPYTIHQTANGKYTGPDLAKAKRLVAASGTKGQVVTILLAGGDRRGTYLESVLRSIG